MVLLLDGRATFSLLRSIPKRMRNLKMSKAQQPRTPRLALIRRRSGSLASRTARLQGFLHHDLVCSLGAWPCLLTVCSSLGTTTSLARPIFYPRCRSQAGLAMDSWGRGLAFWHSYLSTTCISMQKSTDAWRHLYQTARVCSCAAIEYRRRLRGLHWPLLPPTHSRVC